ncbi:AB hydrolase-1 domain-containing protein [Caenorhabditis elegans]|uniref:AB hydrolase-1 domain-containing protein n=1 Tax=Caenorhabditis elegans TaxID=6239 RepID=Q9U1Z6_CAEEL|nr:Serine aminopeptidase S33 domain-containing protein [Caenorhabditis elegans]CAB60395.1 Serine aminopeptidase S33 domain-containing protein [Caenorhabditis elegans]|eukprot:NP_507863.1 ABHydrolase Domain containing homolog [Caenorhabditis elegans]
MVITLILISIIIFPILLWLYSWYITDIPKVYVKSGTKLYEKVKANLRILEQKYHPSWWCPFGTTQTIVRQVFRDCPTLPFKREIVEFSDGGAAGIDWLIPEGADDDAPIVVFLPGITGSTHDCSYVLHPVMEARDKGWRSVVVNQRGLGGVKLKNSRTYNAASCEDLEFICKMIKERFPKARKFGCGFSMGGMILWNYLAKVGENADLDGGMIVSSPWEASAASDSIELFVPRMLFNSFIAKNLTSLVSPYRHLFADLIDFDNVCKSKTIRGFDENFIVPMFGFKDCAEYYTTASLATKVAKIKVPCVTLNSYDDYFSPIECIPTADIMQSDHVVGIITNHGGHTAFMESADPNARGLVEKLLSQWGNLIFHDYN